MKTLILMRNSLDKNLKMKYSVSAIVPVFNEEKTVGDVVKALVNSKLISEVICINDGSTDGSRAILKSFGKRIVFIDLKENHGKGYAVGLGVEKAKGEIIVFFDSDLKGLNDRHINVLIKPLLSDEKVSGVIGVPRESTSVPMRELFNSVYGERAYHRKDLLPHVKKLKGTRRGVELFLNSIFIKKKVLIFHLHSLTHIDKFKKTNPFDCTKDYLLEGFEFGKVLLMTRLR